MQNQASRSRRAKASREKGIRFERRVARLLRDAGFVARRILEYDGFQRGADIEVLQPINPHHPNGAAVRIPAAIQCKATKDPRDLERGLQQAIDHNPTARLHACLHSNARHIRVLVRGPDQTTKEIAFEDLVHLLRQTSPLSGANTH